MKNLRRIHLYLGCIFAPMILLFAITGSWQIFELHESKKEGYTSPPILRSLTEIHIHQKFNKPEKSSPYLKIFTLIMAVGLTVSTILGILIALQSMKNSLIIYFCLALGIFIPVLFLWLNKV